MTISTTTYLAVDNAARILNRAVNVNQDAIDAWNQEWAIIFDSQLFAIVVYMATFAGVVAIAIWMAEEAKEFNSGEALFRKSFYSNLFWAIFIMAMLVPGGNRLSSLVQGLHTFGQEFNQQALEFQLNDIALEDAIRATVSRGTLKADIEAQVNQCTGLVGERQFACFSNAHEQVKQMIVAYQSDYLVAVPQRLQDIADGLGSMLVPITNIGVLYNGVQGGVEAVRDEMAKEAATGDGNIFLGGVKGIIGGAMSGQVQAVSQMVLMFVQWAFVNALELAMLLTALVSPFALALSFIPGKGRPIIAWILAYLSMVMVQFYYNIIVGVMATVVLNSNAYDINGFLIIMAVFGPVLAMRLAKGGGMAVFDAIVSGSVDLVKTAMTTVLKVV